MPTSDDVPPELIAEARIACGYHRRFEPCSTCERVARFAAREVAKERERIERKFTAWLGVADRDGRWTLEADALDDFHALVRGEP